jgi:hypothetical protein
MRSEIINIGPFHDRFSRSEVMAELSSHGFGVSAEEAVQRVATVLGGPPTGQPRVLFISGPLAGQRLPAPKSGTLRWEDYRVGICYEYTVETIDIAGEAVMVGLLDMPDALPPRVQAALDLVATATAEAERQEREAAAEQARQERDRRQDACEHHWLANWDADPFPRPDTVVAYCPACGLGQGPTFRYFRDFFETRASKRTVRG